MPRTPTEHEEHEGDQHRVGDRDPPPVPTIHVAVTHVAVSLFVKAYTTMNRCRLCLCVCFTRAPVVARRGEHRVGRARDEYNKLTGVFCVVVVDEKASREANGAAEKKMFAGERAWILFL